MCRKITVMQSNLRTFEAWFEADCHHIPPEEVKRYLKNTPYSSNPKKRHGDNEFFLSYEHSDERNVADRTKNIWY